MKPIFYKTQEITYDQFGPGATLTEKTFLFWVEIKRIERKAERPDDGRFIFFGEPEIRIVTER